MVSDWNRIGIKKDGPTIFTTLGRIPIHTHRQKGFFMKTVHTVIIFPVLLCLLLATPSFGSNWVICEMDNFGVHYYNKEKVKHKSRDIVQVWTRLVFFQEGKEMYALKKRSIIEPMATGYDNLSETLCVYEIDCKREMSRFLSMTDYDEDGNILYKTPRKSNWYYITPSSIKDTLRKTVCK